MRNNCAMMVGWLYCAEVVPVSVEYVDYCCVCSFQFILRSRFSALEASFPFSPKSDLLGSKMHS